MKAMKALCRNLILVLSVPSGVIGVVAVIMLIIGFRPYILASPSMEPRYPEGSFCLVDTAVEIDELKENDVIIGCPNYVGNRPHYPGVSPFLATVLPISPVSCHKHLTPLVRLQFITDIINSSLQSFGVVDNLPVHLVLWIFSLPYWCCG